MIGGGFRASVLGFGIAALFASSAMLAGSAGPAKGSTVTTATTACKYVDATGRTVFEKQCLVHAGSLMAIKGVRDCNYLFFDVYFTAKARANIWITDDGGKCKSTVNGRPSKVERTSGDRYDYTMLTDRGEIFMLNSEGLL